MKFLILILSCLVFTPFLMAAGHFEIGEKISVSEIDGYVRFYCSDDYVPGTFRFETRYCAAHDIEPDGESYFVTDDFVDADWVKLTATHSDGSKSDKSMVFDSKNKKSAKKFNLLYRALFSKPLLNPGPNTVEYILGKGREVVSNGTFKISVDQGQARRCPSALYNTTQTCNTYSVSVCRNYFQDHNYCH